MRPKLSVQEQLYFLYTQHFPHTEKECRTWKFYTIQPSPNNWNHRHDATTSNVLNERENIQGGIPNETGSGKTVMKMQITHSFNDKPVEECADINVSILLSGTRKSWLVFISVNGDYGFLLPIFIVMPADQISCFQVSASKFQPIADEKSEKATHSNEIQIELCNGIVTSASSLF